MVTKNCVISELSFTAAKLFYRRIFEKKNIVSNEWKTFIIINIHEEDQE
jgi:hypothetical protein